MAIFHLHIKIISRSGGKSAVAAAAYRAAEKITNERDGITHDYTRKRGVVYKEILLPANAPDEYVDRAVLWNAVEKTEKHSRAQLSREIEFALPVELTREQNIALARDYVKRHFADAGMCVDLCIHDKGDGNPHAHAMLTMRPFKDDGTWDDKQRKVYILDGNGNKIYDQKKTTYKCDKVETTDWNEQSKAEEWRAAWADAVNAALKQQNHSASVDHRSYERQGVEQIPQIKLGVAAFQMERRGIRTERGDINRNIEVTNGQIRSQRARIRKVKDWLYAIPVDRVAPTMMDMVSGINSGLQMKSQWQTIRDLKVMAELVIFCKENGVYDIEALANTVKRMHEKHYEVAGNLKKVERRIDTLALHLAHYDNLREHKSVYLRWRKLEPNKRDAFYDKHYEKIEKYIESKKYIDAVMNGKTPIPVREWRKELLDKITEKYALYDEFYKLKNDVKNVERLRRNAEQIMSGNVPERMRTRTHGQEL